MVKLHLAKWGTRWILLIDVILFNVLMAIVLDPVRRVPSPVGHIRKLQG